MTHKLHIAEAALTKEGLGQARGYEPNDGGFNNALSRLRAHLN